MDTEGVTSRSYKDALIQVFDTESNGDEEDWGDCMDEDMLENMWCKDNEESKVVKSFVACPGIPIMEEEIQEWSTPLKNTLIVKVLCKIVNFRLLDNKLKLYW